MFTNAKTLLPKKSYSEFVECRFESYVDEFGFRKYDIRVFSDHEYAIEIDDFLKNHSKYRDILLITENELNIKPIIHSSYLAYTKQVSLEIGINKELYYKYCDNDSVNIRKQSKYAFAYSYTKQLKLEIYCQTDANNHLTYCAFSLYL